MSAAEDVDCYLQTIARLEPDIHSIDTAAGWASIAISLKRIADCMERREIREASWLSPRASFSGAMTARAPGAE